MGLFILDDNSRVFSRTVIVSLFDLFARSWQDSNGFLKPLPKGPLSSQPQPKKAKAKAKRSARTQAMLQPPEPKDCMVRAKDPVPLQCTLHDILPGSASSSKPQHLHCVAADDGDECRCLAPLARGGRCKRNRVEGSFCRQHYLDWSAKIRMTRSSRNGAISSKMPLSLGLLHYLHVQQ